MHITKGRVSHTGAARLIELQISPDDMLTYEEVQKREHMQKRSSWLDQQLRRGHKRESYDVASEEFPLRGYGAGMALFFRNDVLLVGKSEKDSVKLTVPSGYLENFSEYCKPWLGAMRETVEEIGFLNGEMIYKPYIANSELFGGDDALINAHCAPVFSHPDRTKALASLGMQSDNLVRFSCRSDFMQRPLDTISITNARTNEKNVSRGWFYWDHWRSQVNFLYIANVEGAQPFSSELTYGEAELSPSQTVYGIALSSLQRLSHKTHDTYAVRYLPCGAEWIADLKTVPSNFNKAFSQWCSR
jgi:hypothetical protein